MSHKRHVISEAKRLSVRNRKQTFDPDNAHRLRSEPNCLKIFKNIFFLEILKRLRGCTYARRLMCGILGVSEWKFLKFQIKTKTTFSPYTRTEDTREKSTWPLWPVFAYLNLPHESQLFGNLLQYHTSVDLGMHSPSDDSELSRKYLSKAS